MGKIVMSRFAGKPEGSAQLGPPSGPTEDCDEPWGDGRGGKKKVSEDWVRRFAKGTFGEPKLCFRQG